MCSAKFGTEPIVSIRDLKRDECSAIVEAAPTDALSITLRPLKKDETRPSEPDRERNSEVCSAKLPASPSEAVNAM